MLSELMLNSMLIHIDNFLYDSVKYHQKDFKRIFGLPIFARNNIKTFRQTIIQSGLNEQREYLNIILPYIDARIEKKLADVDSSGIYAVIEWFHLPFTRVWKCSSYRIVINASDQSIRREKLLTRMLSREQYRQYSIDELHKSIEMKDNLSSISFDNLKDCIEVKNNYDELTLQQEAVRLAGVINKHSPSSGDLM
jgi:hypothetical protein